MNFLRVFACVAVTVLAASYCPAQQFRKGQPKPGSLSTAALEHRLLSKRSPMLTHSTKPLPGRYLLGRASARSQELRSRVRATNRAPALPRTPTAVILPGILFRDALPGGAIANSVVTGDFNKDGHMDFVVANGGTDDLWIYFGKGDGTFELPRIIPLTRGLTPVALEAADLRGNGTLDLIVAEFDTSTIGVLLGKGDGTFGFEQIDTLPQPPSALVVGDFNHDGKLDIVSVMVTLNSNTLGVPYLATLLGNGTGSFGAPLISMNPGFYSTAGNLAAGDVNGDGLPDVLITGPGLENSEVYINAGNGTFTPGQTIVENGPFNVVLDGRLADLNGDGCVDAAVADGNGDIWIAPGDCTGKFAAPTTVPMGDSNSSLRLADLNGDGHLDLVTTAIPLIDPIYGDLAGNTLSVAFGDGHGNFTPGRDYVGTGQSYSLAIADFNGDGKPDVVSASPDTDTATVYLNDGAGTFGFPQGAWIGLPGVGVLNAPVSAPSFADVNGDGKPDVVLLDEGYNGEYFITTMLNDGTGRFSGPLASDAGITITGDWMGDYRLGDFRNTGHLDFVGIGLTLAASTGTQYVLFAPGNGDGTFGKSTLVQAPGAEAEMGIGDFNGDGKLDFVAVGPNAALTGKQVTVFLGNGDGTFRIGASVVFADTAEEVDRVFVGDFNRDGRLDVLVHTTGNGYWTTASSVWEFLGNGDGTFQSGLQLFNAFQPMTMADVNEDSVPDIVRYDFFWPDGTTETVGPAKFTTYLAQPSGAFSQSSSYAPYVGLPSQAKPYLQFGDPATSSKVADLNGDGKADEIAFQHVSLANGAAYAQVLMGNGDGTFTPTYDVFSFNKNYFFPGYAHDLDGDGRTDLLELDGATSSMHLFKGGAAPAIQIALAAEQVTSSSGCGWVFPNLPTASDRGVTLSSSVPGVSVPASLTIPAGALSQSFCYTLDSSYDWHHVFDIRAQLGSDVAVAYASQSYVVGFSEALSPSTDQVIYPTQSTSPVTVSLTSSQGYASTVHLTCEGLPAGATCAFGSNTLSVSPSALASTTVVVHTLNTTQGGGPVIVVADDGNVTKRQAFNLTVQPLVVDAIGSAPQSTSPGNATASILIVGIPPYQPSCSGFPAGLTCAFSGAQLPYPSNTDLGVNISVPAGLAPGAYPFTVRVASGPTTASVAFTLTITDFSLQPPTTSSDWGIAGSAVKVYVGLQPINGFNGVVNLACSTDFGGACTGGGAGVGGASTLSALSLSVPAAVPTGAHTLTVVAVAGQVTHTAQFPFYVADYSGSLSSPSLTLTRGGNTSVTATVSVTTGFDASVSFSCSGTPELSCAFTPSTIQPTATSPSTANLTIIAGMSASARPRRNGTSAGVLAFGLIFPFGLALGIVGGKPRRVLHTAAVVLVVALILTSLSCGGGSGSSGGGGSGSNKYSLTVSASAAGTNTSRALGTVNVTVNH